MKYTDPIQSTLDANKRARQAAIIQRRISGDLDMLIESDRGLTKQAAVAWLESSYAMSEPQAEHAYALWLEDVA